MGALDVTRTSPNLKQKRIMTLIPDRTGPRISPRRPISIKLISRAEWANRGNCQCAEKVRNRSCWINHQLRLQLTFKSSSGATEHGRLWLRLSSPGSNAAYINF